MSAERFLIADPDMDGGSAWEHFIGTDDGERLMPTRFVYDTQVEEIIWAEAHHQRAWHKLLWDDVIDLESSVKEGNPEALDNPDDFGLVASDELPSWCDVSVTPSP